MNIFRSFILLICNGLLLTAAAQSSGDILLKDFKPVSIYQIPKTVLIKSAYPVIDIHSHDYAQSPAEIKNWVKAMDACGIEKTVLQTYATGIAFDSIVMKYSQYPGRFIFWCGIDFTGFSDSGWSARAVTELQRCYQKGARGIGELGDKGEGEQYSLPTRGTGVHIDDPKLKPLLEKCGEWNIPVSLHIGEDQWMYDKADSTNDGMMNAGQWHVDMNKANKLDHAQLMQGLATALRDNPNTIFIACHLANNCANLSKLGVLFDKYPNLFADIAARYGEISPVPRYTSAFLEKYQDRILYGTDMGMDESMYRITFRILETADEHFYEIAAFNYHWPLYGLSLPKPVLLKIYQTNAAKIINRK